MKFKKRIKEAAVNTIYNTVNKSEKEECNTNLAVEMIVNKLKCFQNINKNNFNIAPSFSKFPRVVLQR
ncbi:hypothetical protein TSAR_004929, partial [Trichomalopsis sarcophagae]